MSAGYTPTTEDIIRYFDAPHYKIDPRRDDEELSVYLGRISVETMQHRIASESAARRWLAQHDADILAPILALVEPIIDASTGRVGTHYEGCHRLHLGCLAVLVRDAAGGTGVRS